jgi:membrane protein DedA with SNARE-associated domain
MDHLLAQYGYATVALLVAAEGLGIPLPGETALIAGAALSARGHLSLPWVIVTATIGVALGGCGGYWIGRTGGQAVIVRYGKWVGIKEEELNRARAFFSRHGTAAVFIGRFLPVIRILTGLTAGITEMSFARFAVVNAIAGFVWAVAYGVLGYESSRNVFRFEHQYGWIVVVGLVVAAIAAFGAFKWQQRRRIISKEP